MNKKSFEDYKVEDFIADESFINYHFRLNERDRNFWHHWLIKNTSKRLMAKEASQIIQTFSLTLSEKEYQHEFAKINSAINKKESPRLFSLLNRSRTSQFDQRKGKLIKYVSLSLLICAAGISYLLTHPLKNKNSPLNQTVNSGNNVMTFTLSDSTIVTLAPNSMLQYPLSFEGKNRQVYLQGEASFNVKRNEHLPFKVHTENIITTVLGTIFNIKKPGDSAVVVELLKGKVRVEIEDTSAGSPDPILLSPDEKATYVFRDKHFYKNTTPTIFNVSFRQSSFEEIAVRIKNIFGKTVINHSTKKEWRFTGEFKTTTAKEIIENICLIKNLKNKLLRDTIFITN